MRDAMQSLLGMLGFVGMVVALAGVCASVPLLFSPWPWASALLLGGGAALWVGSWSAFEWSTKP